MFGRKKEKQKEKRTTNPASNQMEEQTSENGIEKNPVSNREIAIVTYIFIGLFVLLIGYISLFLSRDNKEIISNPYNKRQDLLAEKVERGKILGSKGEVLAETKVDKKGNEVRSYPYDYLFCHIVGRLNKGKTGIEASQNLSLLTSNLNPVTMLLNELRGQKNVGDNVKTTLNVKMQKAAYEALGSHKGAVVVMEPDSGKILAMVSKPSYNPNTIDEKWESILKEDNSDSVLLNRASQGLYPPGSTFKILTALAYIKQNEEYGDFHFNCTGTITVQGRKIKCYNNKKHGKVDLTSAFAKSCNGAFIDVGLGLDIKKFRETCKNMLFNVALPIQLEYNKSSFTLNQQSDTSEIAQTAIGQGKTLVSPLHNAMIASAVANGGVLMTPYVVDGVVNQDGDVIQQFEPIEAETLMSKKEAKNLYQMMRETVNAGTAAALRSSSYEAAGKTGSAEVGSGKKAHAWFVGTAKKGGKRIAISVIVEEVGTGSDYAVPIARRIFDAW